MVALVRSESAPEAAYELRRTVVAILTRFFPVQFFMLCLPLPLRVSFRATAGVSATVNS